MVAIIIAAHGESAPALLGSTTMIVGDVDNVHAVTFVPGQGPDDLLEAYGTPSATATTTSSSWLTYSVAAPTTRERASSPNAKAPTLFQA